MAHRRVVVFYKDRGAEEAHLYADRIARKFHLTVTSGPRTKEENDRVGGSPTSYHLRGLAFDFVPRRSGLWGRLDKAKAWALLKFNTRTIEVLWRTTGHWDHLHIAFKPGSAKPCRHFGRY